MALYDRDRLLVFTLRGGVVQREHHFLQRTSEMAGLERVQDGDFARWEDQRHTVVGGHYQYFVSLARDVPARHDVLLWLAPPPQHDPLPTPLSARAGRWWHP
jgi:hypothetical protein